MWLIARKSLRQHALSTAVTVLSLALGSALVMAVFTLEEQSVQAFTGGPVGFDAVLGARGSQLQLVLNTVFHLETSPGNIPWSLYQEMKNDKRRVALAVPYAVGDNYRGYRIVGTTTEMFTEFEYRKGRKFELYEKGRVFDQSRRESVIGCNVARNTGLRVGSTFNAYHGVEYAEREKHPEEFVVVGILLPTNSPSDNVVWIPIEGIFRMQGHQLMGTGEVYKPEEGVEIPEPHKEVSAVMLKFRNPQDGFLLAQTINKQGKVATLAFPIAQVMADFFNKMGWIQKILRLVAVLVVVVAAASILASIYNTMNERRREFAILRALGARRATVSGVIVLEAGTIAFLGSLLGFLFYGVILSGAAFIVRRQTGVVVDIWAFHPSLWWTPLGVTLIGALAGLIPAFKAYSTDVATHLAPAT